MGPPRSVRMISQEAFDEMVKENIEDLGMEPSEALEDAMQTLKLQGVDLSGIVTCIPGVTSSKDNPILMSLDGLREMNANLLSSKMQKNHKQPTIGSDLKANALITNDSLEGYIELLDKLYASCSIEGSGNASIATRNGGVELLASICSLLDVEYEQPLISALKTLGSFLHDLQSAESFRQSNGPKIIVDILNNCSNNMNVLESGFFVVAAAATGNEVLKEAFVVLNIDELLLQTLKGQSKGCIQSVYEALRVLITPDDNRVLASQVYSYARRFAKVGIAAALVDTLQEGISSPSLASANIALKALAVNDEICSSIAECGGIDAVLRCLDDSGEQNNKAIAKASCSLLSKLAGSDLNKSAIVQKGGLDRLMKLSSKFSDDPFVLQEIMSVIGALSLRSPDNAARAVKAGAGDFAMEAMLKFPAAAQLQRQSCLMLRNLVVRNPENRTILLSNGIEKIIRKAKGSHRCCKEAAADALRDLGIENYNS